MQAVNDAESGQKYESPGDTQLGGPAGLHPNEQAHAEKGQSVKEVDDDYIVGEQFGNRIHGYLLDYSLSSFLHNAMYHLF